MKTLQDKSVLNLVPRQARLSTWDCPQRPQLLLSAPAAPAPAAVDRYLLPARHSAANPPATVAAVERWDRQMDGRTDARTYICGQCQRLENLKSKMLIQRWCKSRLSEYLVSLLQLKYEHIQVSKITVATLPQQQGKRRCRSLPLVPCCPLLSHFRYTPFLFPAIKCKHDVIHKSGST